jgi:lactate dehydrogenase-like 2-hydroxyacid dehydrogenase
MKKGFNKDQRLAPKIAEDCRYRKVVILDSVILYPEHRSRLSKISEQIIEYPTCNSEEEVLQRIKGADCVISCWVNVSNSVIDANPQLRTIAFWTHAYEHRIDRDYALAHNIHVPCIPDYGTDSVAELVFIGLHNLYKKTYVSNSVLRSPQEEVLTKIISDVRKFEKNCKNNLRGSWIHEYIKSGDLKIDSSTGFSEETLKGLTVGFLTEGRINSHLIQALHEGFRMNLIHSLHDSSYDINIAFRPIENLLKESHVIVYDSRFVNDNILDAIKSGTYLSAVDISKVKVGGVSIRGKRLGIVGLGRIGARVAQIAKQGFDMDVAYFSRTRKPQLETKYGIKYKSLKEILTMSDIISFHLPHVGAEGAITNEMVSLIPAGTTVVNVSVGNIFQDQKYFFSRFAQSDLNGYVDVYDMLPPRSELCRKKDFLLSTYRLGWRTKSTIGLKSHKLVTKLISGLSLAKNTKKG